MSDVKVGDRVRFTVEATQRILGADRRRRWTIKRIDNFGDCFMDTGLVVHRNWLEQARENAEPTPAERLVATVTERGDEYVRNEISKRRTSPGSLPTEETK